MNNHYAKNFFISQYSFYNSVRMSDMNDIQPATAWTEEEWDPMYSLIVLITFSAIARKRRNEMKNQMSEEAKEEQRRYEVNSLYNY